MGYKIIVDSCGELTEEMKRSGYYETASLGIDIDEHHIVDRAPTHQSPPAPRLRPTWRDTAARLSASMR